MEKRGTLDQDLCTDSMEPQQHAMELAAASLDAYDRAHCNSGIALATAVLHLHAAWTMFSEKLPQGTALKHAWDFFEEVAYD